MNTCAPSTATLDINTLPPHAQLHILQALAVAFRLNGFRLSPGQMLLCEWPVESLIAMHWIVFRNDDYHPAGELRTLLESWQTATTGEAL